MTAQTQEALAICKKINIYVESEFWRVAATLAQGYYQDNRPKVKEMTQEVKRLDILCDASHGVAQVSMGLEYNDVNRALGGMEWLRASLYNPYYYDYMNEQLDNLLSIMRQL